MTITIKANSMLPGRIPDIVPGGYQSLLDCLEIEDNFYLEAIQRCLPCSTIKDLHSDTNRHRIYRVIIFNDQIITFVTHFTVTVDLWITQTLRLTQNQPPNTTIIVGLDIDRINSPSEVLTLCVGNRCLIYQFTLSPTIPYTLLAFLQNPNFTFVGIGVDEVLGKLWEFYCLSVGNTVDVRYLASEKFGWEEIENAGLVDLVRVVLKKEVEKPPEFGARRWDVDAEWLKYGLVHYASSYAYGSIAYCCADAFLLCEIGRSLMRKEEVSTEALVRKLAYQVEEMKYISNNFQCPSYTPEQYTITIFDDQVITVVTHTPSIVDLWISETLRVNQDSNLIVGLDTEWRPSFKREIQNPVAVLQLCVGSRCLIFQILHSPSIPCSLVNFLGNLNNTFVGVDVGDDVKKLLSHYSLYVTNVVDVRSLAVEKWGRKDLKNTGLKNMVREVLGKEMLKPKEVRLSKWDAHRLTYDQVQYACTDAFVSFEIGRTLMEMEVPLNTPLENMEQIMKILEHLMLTM